MWEGLAFPCIAARGFCGNLGGPVISTDDSAAFRVAACKQHPGPALARRPSPGSKSPAQPWYRQAKENQARREGWREVLASW